MDIIKLNISRDKSFEAAAMPYRILIDGVEMAKLKNGKTISLNLSNSQMTLKIVMVGSSFSFHKIEKEVVLFTKYCRSGVVNCKIKTKYNWLGGLTFGLLQAVVRLELDVEYC